MFQQIAPKVYSGPNPSKPPQACSGRSAPKPVELGRIWVKVGPICAALGPRLRLIRPKPTLVRNRKDSVRFRPKSANVGRVVIHESDSFIEGVDAATPVPVPMMCSSAVVSLEVYGVVAKEPSMLDGWALLQVFAPG